METWRLKAKSVTKYPNQLYDINGIYTGKEWTSYSDINKENNLLGTPLTKAEYLDVENSYIEAVKLFAEKNLTQEIIIFDLYKHSNESDFLKNGDNELYDFYLKLNTINKISIAELGNLIKLILREYIECSLIINIKNNSYVYFGYEFYMYFVSDDNLLELENDICNLGLFFN